MNNKKQNDIKKEVFFELNEELQMKIFDRFLLVQILCTFVGSFSNTIIHGFSPILILTYSTVILDIIVGIIVKKKQKPFLGAWILNILHGFILFPFISCKKTTLIVIVYTKNHFHSIN